MLKTPTFLGKDGSVYRVFSVRPIFGEAPRRAGCAVIWLPSNKRPTAPGAVWPELTARRCGLAATPSGQAAAAGSAGVAATGNSLGSPKCGRGRTEALVHAAAAARSGSRHLALCAAVAGRHGRGASCV